MDEQTILIVENDGIIAKYLEGMLTRMGYRTLEPATTGEKALDTAKDMRPDLVLMDIDLPGETSSIEVAKFLRTELDIPVVYLTGFLQDDQLQEIKETYSYGYLVKPVAERELAATIEIALSRHILDLKLKKSEEKYRILAENTFDSVWVIDPHTFRYTYVSPSAEAISGYTTEEILAMHPDKLLTPETWARAKAHFEKVLESVQAGLPADTPSFEIEITRKNGTRVWLDTTYSLVYDQGGNVVAIQGSNRDISERKKAQQELQSREEQYRILAENISDSVWVMDPHAFKFKYVSPSSEAMAGYTAEEILAMHPDQLLTPETWAKAKANFERVLQASQAGLSVETPPFEIEIIRKDGTSGWVETTYSLIYDEGNIVAIQGSNRDITERKKAQQELQESEGKYRNIFENAPFGIFHATLTGKLVDVNPMMARTFGYASPDDLIAANSADLESLVHGEPDSRPTLLKDVLPASGWCKYEKPFRCKDGRIITANLALRRIPYPTKSGAELEGFVEDITDLKLYQEQLKEKLNEIKKLKEQFEKDNVFLREEVKLLFEHNDIVGESSALNRVLVKAEQVAPTDSIVLIHGETGTGKELLARAIHNLSKRKDRTLITVNCASLPPSLIESELFGHEKGAYTGALTKMIGRFETADGSSLFLDEIGELPYELQGKLLRVIELGRFERLGSAKTIQVDVRLIAATNRDLAQDVKEGKFRKDLFYRLNVFPIELPPLRERVEDIPALVWAFVGQFEKKLGKRIESISQKDIEALKRYSWPGNIRELKNVIEHAMIVSGKTLHLRPPMTPVQDSSELYTLEEYERRYILRVLERTHWRISGKNGAAKMLGVKRTTLHSMLKKLGITRPD